MNLKNFSSTVVSALFRCGLAWRLVVLAKDWELDCFPRSAETLPCACERTTKRSKRKGERRRRQCMLERAANKARTGHEDGEEWQKKMMATVWIVRNTDQPRCESRPLVDNILAKRARRCVHRPQHVSVTCSAPQGSSKEPSYLICNMPELTVAVCERFKGVD